jgi:hypothetical protein
LKEHILEAKQIFVRVRDSPKKPIIGDKTKPLGFQSVRPKSEELGITIIVHKV